MSALTNPCDSELVRRIHCAVDRHPHIRRGRVRFEAAEGRVLICGRVNSFYEKQMAQEAIRSVNGICSIENAIEVCWQDSLA